MFTQSFSEQAKGSLFQTITIKVSKKYEKFPLFNRY